MRNLTRAWLGVLLIAACCTAALGQTSSPGFDQLMAVLPEDSAAAMRFDAMPDNGAPGNDSGHGSLIGRSVRRVLHDQGQLYTAPLKPKNYPWDALFLGGAAALFATDMKIERQVPTTNVDRWHTLSAVDIVGTSVTLGSLWAYGIKTHNDHAKETGVLELEALSNTFLIYTPMQLIAARERPDEGRGGGRFLVQRSFNTSFPAGHPMFTWTMASVVAHEYPKPWVQALAYGAAGSLSVARIMGRNHFSSDVYVGTILGYLIGTHVFHAHCMPGLSKSCHRDITSGN
jgi:membrane-associated phospholipid phosphatase